MVTKRDLGIGYLLGTGLGLIVSLTGYLLLTGASSLVAVIGMASAALLAGSIVSVGYWLLRSDLGDDLVWSVATWSAVGLSVPTFLGVVLTVVRIQPPLLYLFPALLVNVIAAGGVVGVLAGSVTELRKEHDRTRELHRRNLVLNRVLRHNIRNDMNVILGHAENLREDLNGSGEAFVDPIARKARDVVDLSETARQIETIRDGTAERPIDVAGVVEERLESIATSHPDVEIGADLPDEAWAGVDPLVGTVIDNVVENAIEHHDCTVPMRVTVRVEESADGRVIVRVEDNGPGIPEQERRVLARNGETELQHGTGLGLWLVKWFVDHWDGDLRIEESGPRGSTVVLGFPSADPRFPIDG